MSLNLLSLFSGIGAFEKALDTTNIPFNLINYCEIEPSASESYAAIHGVSEELNLGDITKVDTSKLPPIDVITYGFPCQDISMAGHRKGLFNEDGTKTRSGLFFDALRIIEHTQPKVAIAENVKNLVGKKFKEQFKLVLESLNVAGYNNYWTVLNGKDFGVPQNRERVFIVSIRKDLDSGVFEFPEPYELKLKLEDLLEDEVDEEYSISERVIVSRFKSTYNKYNLKKSIINGLDVHPTILARYDGSPSLLVTAGDVNRLRNCTNEDELKNLIAEGLRIRKLTPKETWRLTGFSDEDYEKASKVTSKANLYKLAGNSIVVPVLSALFENIIESGVLDVKKVEEVKTITYECNDLINVAALKEKEPELYADLLKDYPCENATYIFKNNTSVA